MLAGEGKRAREEEEKHGEVLCEVVHRLRLGTGQTGAGGHDFVDGGGGWSYCSWRDGDRGVGRGIDGGGRSAMLT